MQHQTNKNSEILDDFSDMLTSNDSGKRKIKKHKSKTDDAYDSQANGEVLHQKSKEFEKEKGIKRKHKHTRQLDNEISSGGWLLPEIKNESETETSILKQTKKRKRHHESEDISCNVEPLENEKLHLTEIFTKKKKKKKCQRDKESNENWLTEPISTLIITDHEHDPETCEPKKKKKKKKKHRHEAEDETAIQDDGSFMPSNDNLHEMEPEMSCRRSKKAKKRRRENEDEIVLPRFDISWILEPKASPDHATSSKAQHGTNTSHDTRNNENGRTIPSLDDTIVDPSQEPSENDVPSVLNVPAALNVPSQEVLVNVLSSILSSTDSAVHPSGKVPSTANVPVQDALLSVPSANDSPLKSNEDFPSTTNLSPTQNAENNPSAATSTIGNAPTVRESSEKTSDDVSMTHDSVVRFSQKPSSDPGSVCDLTADLSRRSNVSAMNSEDIQSEEHLADDSSVENPVIASSKAGPSSTVQSAKTQLFTEEIPSELSAVSKTSLRTRKVRCIKTSTLEAPEDNSENLQLTQKSVKRRRKEEKHKSSLAKKHKKRTRHPDLPKQPICVYVRYLRDCLKKNPKLKLKEIGKRYRMLRAEDKEKYVTEFLHETKVYNAAVKKFLESHPQHRNHWAGLKRSNLERHTSGCVEIISGEQLYINKMTQKHLGMKADENTRNVKATYRKKWKQCLDEQEKVVYILEAKKLNAMNAASVEDDNRAEDSNEAKPVASSSSREIEEKFLTENLIPPPVNGYQLFIKENANAELLFGEVNRRWKRQLSEEQRNNYSTRAKLARETYKKNLAEFEKKEEIEAEFQNLPVPKSLRNALKDEHKLLVSVRKKSMDRRKKHPNTKTGRPPITGRCLFFKEQMATVSDLNFKVRFAELNTQWKSQSQEERDSYTARAKAAYDKFMAEHPELYRNEVDEESEERNYRIGRNSVENARTRKRRRRLYEGEPQQLNKRQKMAEDILLPSTDI